MIGALFGIFLVAIIMTACFKQMGAHDNGDTSFVPLFKERMKKDSTAKGSN
jgi:peptidoglycan biosynthesis protein MviN/MurJ (putative lipid II flippase)